MFKRIIYLPAGRFNLYFFLIPLILELTVFVLLVWLKYEFLLILIVSLLLLHGSVILAWQYFLGIYFYRLIKKIFPVEHSELILFKLVTVGLILLPVSLLLLITDIDRIGYIDFPVFEILIFSLLLSHPVFRYLYSYYVAKWISIAEHKDILMKQLWPVGIWELWSILPFWSRQIQAKVLRILNKQITEKEIIKD
jgi:hypothetical protein